MVGILPLNAVLCLSEQRLAGLDDFTTRMSWFREHRPQFCHGLSLSSDREDVMAIVDDGQLRSLLSRLLDESEFLSPHGLRALSAAHRTPVSVTVEGVTASVDYEPGESTTNLFGGNSNWRGPVWMPVNFLVVDAIRRYADALGPSWTVECPTGSGTQVPLSAVADELASRLVSLFRVSGDGSHRPVWGSYESAQRAWRDLIPFHEYFHGDTGAGLGASHQTGWTGLVANLILER